LKCSFRLGALGRCWTREFAEQGKGAKKGGDTFGKRKKPGGHHTKVRERIRREPKVLTRKKIWAGDKLERDNIGEHPKGGKTTSPRGKGGEDNTRGK